MSCFLCKSITVDRVVDAIAKAEKRDESAFFHEVEADKLGRELIALNVEAYRQRYGEVPDELQQAQNEYRHVSRWQDSKRVRFVAVCCFIYQCSEGTVTNSLLLERVRRAQIVLASEIAWEACEADSKIQTSVLWS